jgi:hypothetical protein
VAKVTLEQYECDVCQTIGERYTISYPDGMKILDRCSKHNRKILALKEEVGDWTAVTGQSRRGRLAVTTPNEIAKKRTPKKKAP